MEQLHFPRYEDYKSSGFDWLGDIPSGWPLQRLGAVFEARKEKVSDKDFPALSVTKSGILPQLDSAAKSDDGDNRKGVRTGDFVINSRSDRKGSSGIAKQDGSVSLINIVLKPKGIDPQYCEHLLKSNGFIEEFYRNGHGIVADLWTTKYWDMKSIFIPVPDMATQQRIANFLDQKTAEIDEAIAKKQRLIELLKEQKAILINQAVTKGLNPDAPMRDSGVEWIGEVPEHWDVIQNRRAFTKIEQGHSPAINNAVEDNEFSVLKLSAIKQGIFIDGEVKAVPKRNFRKEYQVRKGDFLLTRGNTPDLVADICLVRGDPASITMMPDLVYRISYDEEVLDKGFISYFFQSPAARAQIKLSARGSSPTMVKVGQDHIKSWLIPLPPIDEQQGIRDHLDELVAQFELPIRSAERQIRNLGEFRDVLISNAVTGKIKL
ncbi:restriction endonuclease subunit S [Sedimenticola hydrogenitrophicus]|uniref:restriction endonuclease subunit S n=1 Tax=Sedimenticola hydrogenitrophicus TaxID=2967975 RepID=UPI0023B14040|nr:restriction endonuclease subunit S [Sedimenticola hydrogenitrophicus]